MSLSGTPAAPLVPPPPSVQIIESEGRRALWDYFPDRSNDCPSYLWVFDRAYGRSHAKGWICGSIQHLHESCGIRYTQDEIDKLNTLFHKYEMVNDELVKPEAIYFAECHYDPAVLNRLNQRRHKHGGGMAIIRRGRGHVEGQCRTLHIYAHRRYGGTSWPTGEDWTELSAGDAISQVADKSFRLPGVFTARGVKPITYSGTWDVGDDKKSKGEDEKRFVVLGKARNEEVFTQARAVMNIIAMQLWGVHPEGASNEVGLHQIPVPQRKWWIETSWSVVGSLNAGKTVGEVLTRWI